MLIDIDKLQAAGRVTQEEYLRLVHADGAMRLSYVGPGPQPITLECLQDGLKSVELTPGQAETLHKAIDARIRRESPVKAMAESKEKAWCISILAEIADGELRAKSALKEFATREEAREYLGKLTNEVNNAVVGDIALVRVGDLAFRPKDVAAIEVCEA